MPCMLMPRSIFRLVYCLTAVCSAGAAELVVRDLVINLEFLPAAYDYKLTDSNGSREGSDEFDSALGIAVGGRYSFAGPGDSHGFIIGGELCAAQYGSSDPDGHLTTYGARIEGGYGLALSDRWTVSVLADVGYALATYDVTGGSAFPSFSASGTALSYGAGLGVGFAVTERVLVGVELGYQIRSLSLSGSGIDIEADQAGMRAAFGLTYRFSARPRPLE
jgi:opacity protein-like surface antigen